MSALYARWIVANGLGEAAGLGTTFVLGAAVAPALAGMSGPGEILGGAVAAVVLGTLLEGVVVGAAQAQVLASYSRVRAGEWIRATALGAGIAWLVGMVPSTVMSLMSTGAPAGAAPPAEPGPLLTVALAAALGAFTGPILGVAQWRVLRRVVPGAGRWLWANAAAWAVGMPLIFLGMDRVPWSGGAAVRALALYAVCLVSGLAVGTVHGRVLVALVHDAGRLRPASPDGA